MMMMMVMIMMMMTFCSNLNGVHFYYRQQSFHKNKLKVSVKDIDVV